MWGWDRWGNDGYAVGDTQKADDLTTLGIPTDSKDDLQVDYSTGAGEVEVYFRNQEAILYALCADSDFVLGAVAWMTSPTLIEGLSKAKHGCSIVVQKEDFLRPDIGGRSNWKTELRRRYNLLRCGMERFYLPGIAADLSVGGDPTVAPVRCVGNYNQDKHPAFPRMHNKFLVFCDVEPCDPGVSYLDSEIVPRAVWTGSFNLTANATKSFENGVLIKNEKIADAYAKEWAQIFSLSEPLNWEHNWVTPEWRIGT